MVYRTSTASKSASVAFSELMFFQVYVLALLGLQSQLSHLNTRFIYSSFFKILFSIRPLNGLHFYQYNMRNIKGQFYQYLL